MRPRHALAAAFVVTVATGCTSEKMTSPPGSAEAPHGNPPTPLDTPTPSLSSSAAPMTSASADATPAPDASAPGRRRGPILNPPPP